MKIKITVFGLFHSYHLKTQLDNCNKDCYLYTSYPKVGKIRNKKNVFSTNLEYLNFTLRYLPKQIGLNFNRILRNLHYYLISFFIKKEDIVISWGFTNKHFINKAKNRSKLLIIERGSTHPNFQKNILSDEYNIQKLQTIEFQYSTRIQKYEYELSDYIVVPSDFVKKTFIENGVAATKIFVNPYGVDLIQFKRLEIKKEKFRLIFSGKACIRKGYHYLIEAMKILKEYDIELWHLGSIHPEIEKFDYKQENIVYLGSKPQNELYRYYNQCDVFVLPSLEEGLAMVTLQAMACGLPVICTPNTGIENVITTDGAEGFLIPIRDPIAIKEKVLQLYNNPSLKRKMGEAAYKKVSSGFTWDDYGRRYIEFLNKIQNA